MRREESNGSLKVGSYYFLQILVVSQLDEEEKEKLKVFGFTLKTPEKKPELRVILS